MVLITIAAARGFLLSPRRGNRTLEQVRGGLLALLIRLMLLPILHLLVDLGQCLVEGEIGFC